VSTPGPRLGFGLPVSGAWATPATVRHVARRAEDLAYDSLWTFQRLLDPVDAGLGPGHHSVLDPLLALAHVAGHTERIGLGTATVCAPFTPPPVLAKAMATLDVLCDGRLTVGVGMGWLPQEYEASGIPFVRRGARMDEYLRCLAALWTTDPVEFAGEFYTVPRSHVRPRPVQRPRPPVLVGGTAEPALRRAGRLAEGWIGGSSQDPARIPACVAAVRTGAREAGRDPDAVRIVLRVVPDLRSDDPPHRRPFAGTREQVLADLVSLADLGVTEAFLDLNLSPRVGHPDVDPAEALDHAEQVLEAFAPQPR
jgi:probable F420-dependent oxidoreductase